MNKGYTTDWLDNLKSKNEIVSTISRYIKLDKKGKNYWARCPFHHEKTPSFCVNEYEQFYKCFGCGESGDVISFIEKYESIDFRDAIKLLADSAGIEIPNIIIDDKIEEKNKLKNKTITLLNDACKHYMENLLLPSSVLAQNYIRSRGLTKRELDDFKIGYSRDWTEMIDYLVSLGYTTDEMKIAGICEMKQGRKYDVFGGRLIFPIINTYDDCIGFSGRLLEKSDFAKYKNTAATLVFDKGKTVYAINLLKRLKQEGKLEHIVLVEGQMDVIAMHRAGYKNTVACMGTALTERHAKELRRFSDNVYMLYDGDEAGKKAVLRNIDILDDAGLDVKVVCLPDKLDPDDYLKQFGKPELDRLFEEARSVIEYKLESVFNKYDLTKANEKSKFLKESLNILRGLETNSEKDTYLDYIKNKSGVPIDVLRRDLTDFNVVKTIKKKDNDNVVLINREDVNILAVKYVLASLLYKKEYSDFNIDITKYLINPTHIKLYKIMKDKAEKGEKFIIGQLYNYFDIEKDNQIDAIINYNFEKHASDLKRYYDECIWTLREGYLLREQSRLTTLYKNIEDLSQRKQITEELKNIIKKLKKKILED